MSVIAPRRRQRAINEQREEVVFNVRATAKQKAAWWRWPENRFTGRVPWFVTVRRLVFWLPLAVGIVLAYLAIIGGHGREDANRWLKSAI